MSLDPEIRALINAASRGEAVPEITVMAGGMLIIGQPAEAKQFALAGRQSIVDEHTAKLIPAGGWRGLTKVNKVEARDEAERLADEAMRLLQENGDAEVDSLTLVHARVLPAQGDGVLLPAVRVPAAAIDAWWLGYGQIIKAPPSVFFAAGFPVPS
jgi:hypothetical protein